MSTPPIHQRGNGNTTAKTRAGPCVGARQSLRVLRETYAPNLSSRREKYPATSATYRTGARRIMERQRGICLTIVCHGSERRNGFYTSTYLFSRNGQKVSEAKNCLPAPLKYRRFLIIKWKTRTPRKRRWWVRLALQKREKLGHAKASLPHLRSRDVEYYRGYC